MSEINWGRYNLPAIASLLSDVNVCDGADRVLAWDGLASAVRDQHQRLLAAADRLAAVWPADRNDSALEFQRQVRGLADSMQETLSRAEDTRAGLNGVVQAFATAQSRVRDLAAGREGVADDWLPRFVDHAEDKYDEQAQSAMRDAERAISDHGAQIQPPSLFQMRPAIGDDGHHLSGDDPEQSSKSSGGDGARSGLRATANPVPIERDPSGVSPDSPAQFGSSGSAQSGSGAAAGASSGGPVLSGLTPTMPGSPGPAAGGGSIPAVPVTPVGSGSLPPGVLPIGGSPPVGGGFVGRLPGGTPGVRSAVPVRRAMPSGAVIGEDAERAAGRGGGAPTAAMPIGAAGGGRNEGRRRSQGLGGTADQQWMTEEGVAPVIRPDTTEVRHDAGPGVIGFDR